jgi:hypothetical protein
MANKYVGAAQFVGEKIIKPIVKSFTKKQKTTGTEVIKSFKPVKNLTTKRKIQDKTVKAIDEGTKKGMKAAGADPKFLTSDQKTALRQSMSKIKREKSKELKDYSYRLDKLTEKKATGGRVGKMGGGMMGRRMGYSQGSNGKPISRSKNPGILAMSKTAKGRKVVKERFKFNPDRIVAKKGGKA